MPLQPQPEFPFNKLPTELRIHIHSFLEGDRVTLFNAIRVNKEWFHRLIGFLWHEPGSGALLYLTKGRRRQFYADKIRTIERDVERAAYLGNGAFLHWTDILSECEIPYLEKLTFDGDDAPADEVLCPLLRPSLLSVEIPWELSATAIKCLRRCNRLRHLALKGDVVISDLKSFMEVIEKLPYLSSIELGGDIVTRTRQSPFRETHTNKVLARLLKHGRLTQLKLGSHLSLSYLSDDDPQKISNLVNETLPGNEDLTSLSIRGTIEALKFFLANTALSLQTLELTIPVEYGQSGGNLCENILRFINLRELRLNLEPEQTLHPNGFAALGGMNHLRVLKIANDWSDYDNVVPGSSWTNKDFVEWISNFSELRELELLWRSSCLDENAVAAIGRSCRKLERCTLGWAQDISTWTDLEDHDSVLFPKLKKLGICAVDEQSQQLQHLSSREMEIVETEWDEWTPAGLTQSTEEELTPLTPEELIQSTQKGLTQLNTILNLAPHLRKIQFVGSKDVSSTSTLQMGFESVTEMYCKACRVWKLDKDVVDKIQEASWRTITGTGRYDLYLADSKYRRLDRLELSRGQGRSTFPYLNDRSTVNKQPQSPINN